MKKIITGFILTVLVLSLCITSYGAVILKSDIDTGNFTLEGKIGEAVFNQSLSLSVNSGAEILFMSAVPTDNEGNFRYSFNIDNYSGLTTADYELYIGAYDLESPVNMDLSYVKKADAMAALSDFNTACSDGDRALVISKLQTDKKLLGINNPYFENATGSVQEFVADAMIALYPHSGNISDFASSFYEAYGKKIFMQADLSNVKDIAAFFEDCFKLKDEIGYSRYDLFNESNKTQVLSRLCGKSFDNINDLRKAFCQSVILTALETAANPDIATAIYNDLYSQFSFSLSAYSDWNTRNLATASMGQHYSDMPSLKAVLDLAYSKRTVKKEETVTPPPSDAPYSGPGSGTGTSGGSGVSIGSELLPPAQTRPIFNDMADHGWANEAVESLYKKNIISGDGKGNFEPARNITRQEFVKMIISAFSLVDKDAKCEFSDVGADSWSYLYVSSAVEKGIVKGMGDDYFGANEYITRQDMFTMAKRIFDYMGKALADKKSAPDFSDKTNIADYALSAVTELFEAGIVSGYEDGSVRPLGNATRAESAIMIYKMLS